MATARALIADSGGDPGCTVVTSFGAGTLTYIVDPTVHTDDISGTGLAITPANLVKGGIGNITGIAKLTAGVLSAATSGTDYGTVSSVGLTMPTGFTVSSSPVTGSGTIAVTTSLSGILKGSGGAFTTASAGTDYLAPSGSGAALTGITASQIGSVPSGIIKGSGGAFAAATAWTDYAKLLTPTVVKTTAYNAVNGDFVPCDSTSAGFTVTLPNAPADMTIIGVKHAIQGGSNAITVACSGTDHLNRTTGPTSTSLSSLGRGSIFQYQASTGIWYVVARDIGAVLASDISSGQVALAQGGTASDLSATGGSKNFLKQSSTGAAITVGTIAGSDLSAVGSSGLVIYNNGGTSLSGAANISVGSTSGELVLGSISAPTISGTGQVWNDSTQGTLAIGDVGLPVWVGGLLYQALSSGTANTSGSSASIFSGVSTTIGTRTIPANSLKAGKVITAGFFGTCSGASSSPTCAFVVKLGSTTLCTTSNGVYNTNTGQAWYIQSQMGGYQVQVLNGASSKIIGIMAATVQAGAGTIWMPTGATNTAAPVQVTFDSTASNAFDILYSCSTGTCSFQLLGGWIRIEG